MVHTVKYLVIEKQEPITGLIVYHHIYLTKIINYSGTEIAFKII